MASTLEEPFLLFVSELENDATLKLIRELPGIIESESDDKPIIWKIDTKYYMCDVRIHISADISSVSPDLLKLVEAVCIIIHADKAHDCDRLASVRAWNSELNSTGADLSVRLLLLAGAPDPAASEASGPSAALTWCLDNDFELVEMAPAEGEEEEEEEDFACFGMARVRDALNCASWSNMKLKAKGGSSRHTESRELVAELQNIVEGDAESQPEDPKPVLDAKTSHELIDELLAASSEETGEEVPLEELFQHLADFQAKAGTMSHDQRKQLAEEVTLKIWKAIGGSDSDVDSEADD